MFVVLAPKKTDTTASVCACFPSLESARRVICRPRIVDAIGGALTDSFQA